ncbi:MAG TPA: 2Fe-2S iron-sulfur cluster-binding protein [Pseudolabrys sp.]|nr:2Fe-2S iron-sulfur cluster-binding protein [Pseudolabrys sp.]
MKIHVTDHDGAEHELEALPGWRVMEIIRDWELPIKAECGGACACATCHVYVGEDWLDRLPELSDDELDQLAILKDRRANSRLSCQVLMSEELDGIRVALAPAARP